MIRLTGDNQKVFRSAGNEPLKLRLNVLHDASHRAST
jgi:hypothetical protein